MYLLQPNGEAPIEETDYLGYGEFGGFDAFIWLADMNLTPGLLEGKSDDDKRLLGIGIDCGTYYEDIESGSKWLVFHDYQDLVPDANYFPGSYSAPIPELGGKSANELIDSGVFVERDISSQVRFPLKFSFNKGAVYEELPASGMCHKQGYFY